MVVVERERERRDATRLGIDARDAVTRLSENDPERRRRVMITPHGGTAHSNFKLVDIVIANSIASISRT